MQIFDIVKDGVDEWIAGNYIEGGRTREKGAYRVQNDTIFPHLRFRKLLFLLNHILPEGIMF